MSLSVGHRNALYGLAALLISVTLIHLIIVVIQLSGFKNMQFRSILFPAKMKTTYYFQLLVFVLSLIFSCLTIAVTSNGCCVEWQWHFGLFAVSLGWANLIHLFFKFPFVGEHAIIFATIVVTFLKLAVFALLLILASTIVLMMVFFDAEAMVSL